jgi:hypothetical protein
VSARPGKKREEAPGTASLVAKIEVIGSRIVEVYRALYQPEAQEASVEVEVSLRITRDGGDVMDAADSFRVHSQAPEILDV